MSLLIAERSPVGGFIHSTLGARGQRPAAAATGCPMWFLATGAAATLCPGSGLTPPTNYGAAYQAESPVAWPTSGNPGPDLTAVELIEVDSSFNETSVFNQSLPSTTCSDGTGATSRYRQYEIPANEGTDRPLAVRIDLAQDTADTTIGWVTVTLYFETAQRAASYFANNNTRISVEWDESCDLAGSGVIDCSACLSIIAIQKRCPYVSGYIYGAAGMRIFLDHDQTTKPIITHIGLGNWNNSYPDTRWRFALGSPCYVNESGTSRATQHENPTLVSAHALNGSGNLPVMKAAYLSVTWGAGTGSVYLDYIFTDTAHAIHQQYRDDMVLFGFDPATTITPNC